MCGIAGIISVNGKPIENVESRLELMLSKMDHRGPDGRGIFVSNDGLVGMANNRLAIVDPNRNIKLPLIRSDISSVISFNGEIYNYKELRKNLESKSDYKFETNTDTEVLLCGLHNDPLRFLNNTDGFFAFCFYSIQNNQVILARDLFGEKQLFYKIEKDELIFASEVAPIISVMQKSESISKESIVSGFRFRAAEPSKTLIENIFKLNAGQCFILKPGDLSSLKKLNYRRLYPENWIDKLNSCNEKQISQIYEEALIEAVKSRVPLEVPYMATLSGGVDSTIINIFLNIIGEKKVNTLFGISTEGENKRGDDLGELAASEFTSNKLNTNHHIFKMIDQDSIPLYLDASKNAFDGLFCEGIVSFRQLGREARKNGFKVLLLSDAPDEFLTGYDVDIESFHLMKMYKKNKTLRRLERLAYQNNWIYSKIKKNVNKHRYNFSFVNEYPFFFRPNHAGTSPIFLEDLFENNQLTLSNTFGTIPSDYDSVLMELDFAQKMALSYATRSLPDYYNLRSDRGVMKESVEARLPFQNIKLAELMIATPEKWRFVDKQKSKYILRKFINDKLGKVVSSRGKYGFAYPAWHKKENRSALGFQDVFNDKSFFTNLGFNKRGVQLLEGDIDYKFKWFCYCLYNTANEMKRIRTENKINSKSSVVQTKESNNFL